MEQKKALGQISSLIKLLTDRDEFVRNRVRDQLVELGEDALPFLEMATRGEDEALRIQAHLVIQNPTLKSAAKSLMIWHKNWEGF